MIEEQNFTSPDQARDQEKEIAELKETVRRLEETRVAVCDAAGRVALDLRQQLAEAKAETATLKEDLEFARQDAEAGHIFNRELKAEILRLQGATNQEVAHAPTCAYWGRFSDPRYLCNCKPLILHSEQAPVRIQGEIRRGEELGDRSRVVDGQPQASTPTGSTASSHEVKST